MSTKQLRKLQASKEDAAASDAESSDGEGGVVAASNSGPRGFAMLADSSDEEAEAPAAAEAPEVKEAKPTDEPRGKAKKSKKKKAKGKGAKTDDLDAADDEDALLDRLAAEAASAAPTAAEGAAAEETHVLSMSKSDFRPERERRRLFGAEAPKAKSSGERRMLAARQRGAHEGCFAHHRKLFLIEPSAEEQWPRPEATAKMTSAAAAESDAMPMFGIATTPEHSRVRAEFAGVQMLHDPNEVQHFLQERPYCVEALVVLSDICRGAGEHEQAFQLLRRAVYAVECSFDANFSPFALSGGWPRVRLALPNQEDPAWPGWPWMSALWAYMLGLGSQGLNRSALEVCKLMLAASLPRDPVHALIHCDVLCLRAGDFEFLKRLAWELVPPSPPSGDGLVVRLDCVLPNFAYSVALGCRLSSTGGRGASTVLPLDEAAALRSVTVANILPPSFAAQASPELGVDAEEAPSEPHVALMRAMLFFPQVLRPLLEGAGVNLDASAPAKSPYRSTWSQLLEQKPFTQAREFRHSKHFLVHALIADAYAQLCAPLWRGEPTLCWMHACAGRLVKMSESSLFEGEFAEARGLWSKSPLSLEAALSLDYRDFTSAEVGAERRAPAVLERAMNSLLPGEGLGPGHQLGVGPGPGPARARDDEEELQRTMQASLAFEESRERRRLLEEQDMELQESIAVDRAKGDLGASATGEERPSAELTQLLDMGFERAAAENALAAAGGDAGVAVGMLTS